jgi:hypothetical protein
LKEKGVFFSTRLLIEPPGPERAPTKHENRGRGSPLCWGDWIEWKLFPAEAASLPPELGARLYFHIKLIGHNSGGRWGIFEVQRDVLMLRPKPF